MASRVCLLNGLDQDDEVQRTRATYGMSGRSPLRSLEGVTRFRTFHTSHDNIFMTFGFPPPPSPRVPGEYPRVYVPGERPILGRQGIALVEERGGKDGKKSIVTYVPASGLPFAPAERLAALFQIKSKWPMGELEPYIS